ncbi:MAG: protein-L-isoaspartate(D-aspartate) O-methyltransferase [Gammaproteobacteria bacterium]|jgi:protein-L-isoaspartate(D-aspartate) O-methyltransferase
MKKTAETFEALREFMVERHVAARGIHDENVLNALRMVRREAFVPEELQEFAYEDSPLPIAEGQTISQPYIVALMIDALELKGGEKVLEIGAGSGYAAAVLAEIAGNVYTVERLAPLATKAAATLDELGYKNVHVLHGDGTKGWRDHAPYDAIVVAAGGPSIPDSLKSQLKIGGRLVIPVGSDPRVQELVRVVRRTQDHYVTEDIADVRFVPLVGSEGWTDEQQLTLGRTAASPKKRPSDTDLIAEISAYAEPFESIESCNLEPLLQRIGDSRIVLLGEASHGTSEFYRMRARITKHLIEEKGFSFVAIEGDWPDVARIDHFVRHFEYPPAEWVAFARFPMWMWRNHEVREFVDWLRLHNSERSPDVRTAFYGLDLYSLYSSIRSILEYLDTVDPKTAASARQRYGCLTPWQSDPASYGQAVLTGHYRTCEKEVVGMLGTILEKVQTYTKQDGERYLDAIQNARLVADAEHYYRTMYYGSRESWNLRDSHMFETLESTLKHHGAHSKAVVWAHNSHIGDAAATEMSARGEYNIGQLCRKAYGHDVYAVGFGTDHGTVAAASDWGAPVEIKTVRPSIEGSFEKICHLSGIENFLLPLRNLRSSVANEGLNKPLLERAIGVIYRPDTELQSHYFQAIVPAQFDEYIWFDTSSAVRPIATHELEGLPDTYPFGL